VKIVTILGARPQFIKAGSVSREISFQKQAGVEIEEIIIHTGQHYDPNMSDIFFEEMKIPKPNYFLGICGKSHAGMTGQMMEKIEEVLLKENPDWVLVYGDTNSTLAGALAATKLHIKIAHVEAGLRSFNKRMPEEINRILTDRVSNLLFCPTEIALENLKKEGIDNWGNQIKAIQSGDVMYEGALFYQKIAQKPTSIKVDRDFILCTIHRAENTDDLNRLNNILKALNQIGKAKQVIIPLHPRTRKIIELNNLDTSNLSIVNPLGYLNMIWLIDHCNLVMTDSGGLQKEAYFFLKPCITLREETEWLELVKTGTNFIVGADEQKILDAYNHLTKIDNRFFKTNLYGNGLASKIIISELVNTFLLDNT
jgi:UDP-GlcNAc3NAcA epimerase